MRYIQLITVGIGLLMLSACSDSDLTILEVHGASSDKLDVLLVPSHYYGPDAGSDQQWLTDAERVRAGLIEHHFWINYREKINVYRLDISTDDDFFMSGNNWIPDDQRIKAFAQQHFPGLDFGHNDQIIFVIDVAGYESDPLFDSDIGLTRGDPNITKLEMSKLGALVHEFGHAFGDLGDEYPKQINNPTWVSIYPNIATTQPNDTCEDKWGDLMDVVTPTIGIPIGREDRMVGCFQSSDPASAAITFKPTGHMCIMDRNSFNLPFCPVCQRHLVTLMAQYSPSASCAASPAEFRNRASFEQAAGGMLTLIDFDTLPNGVPIQADSPGVLIESQFASEGLQFTSGVIFGEPNLPFGGVSPPNTISNSGINLQERSLVSGYFDEPTCAIGLTNVGAGAVLRIYDDAFNLITSISSDTDSAADDFVGILAARPIHRFEFDFESGLGFGGDDLLVEQ